MFFDFKFYFNCFYNEVKKVWYQENCFVGFNFFYNGNEFNKCFEVQGFSIVRKYFGWIFVLLEKVQSCSSFDKGQFFGCFVGKYFQESQCYCVCFDFQFVEVCQYVYQVC